MSGGWYLLFLAAALPLHAATAEVADAAMHRDLEAVRALLSRKADPNVAQADGATALHWAARWDDTRMASLLIGAGARTNRANADGVTPLFLAAEVGSAAMISTLFEGGADVNLPVLPHGETALMLAARTGKPDAVKVLLDHGAAVNAKDNLRGTTALMWAAEEGHSDVIRLLIEHGAEVRAQSAELSPPARRGLGFASSNIVFGASSRASAKKATKGGLTALLFAAREDCLDCVRALLDAEAPVDQTSVDGSSPLLVAVQNGNFELARFLLERGASPNLMNLKGWTPLYLAVKIRNQEATAIPAPSAEGALDFIKALLEEGADPNVRLKAETEVHQGMTALWLKEPGATPLLRAALCGDLTVVRVLLAHGADPLLPTFDHTTPLMVAAGVGWADGMIREYSEGESLELVKLLLDRGADVNAANDHGITALHGAAYKGANQVVQLLVERGGRLDAKDNGEDYGFGARSVKMTPLNWAEGVPIGMSSAIYHADTVALLSRLMGERGIPVVRNIEAAK
jgi:uncharacterized protein